MKTQVYLKSLITIQDDEKTGDLFLSKLISFMYTLHVYNGMMGVILLTVELISLGSTVSTYPPPGHLTMIKLGLTQQ